MEKEKEENIWRMKNREISGEVKYFLFRVEGKGEKCLEKENILFPWTGRDGLTLKGLLEVLADLLSIFEYVGP